MVEKYLLNESTCDEFENSVIFCFSSTCLLCLSPSFLISGSFGLLVYISIYTRRPLFSFAVGGSGFYFISYDYSNVCNVYSVYSIRPTVIGFLARALRISPLHIDTMRRCLCGTNAAVYS